MTNCCHCPRDEEGEAWKWLPGEMSEKKGVGMAQNIFRLSVTSRVQFILLPIRGKIATARHLIIRDLSP